MRTGVEGRVGIEPFPTSRVLPPNIDSSSSSSDPSVSERVAERTRGDPLPSLNACRLACAFSRSLVMISCVSCRLLSISYLRRKRKGPYQNFLRLKSWGGFGEKCTSRIKLHKRGRRQTQRRATRYNGSQDNLSKNAVNGQLLTRVWRINILRKRTCGSRGTTSFPLALAFENVGSASELSKNPHFCRRQ